MANNALPSKRTKIANGIAWCLVAAVAGPPAVMVFCYLLFCTWMCVGWGFAFARDHISGEPLRLERPMFLASPDRRTEFIAERDGTFRLVNIASGQVVQSHTYSTEDYTSVDAKWTDNDNLNIDLAIRYPAMAREVYCHGSVKSGFSPE